jgi:hypothetical protein
LVSNSAEGYQIGTIRVGNVQIQRFLAGLLKTIGGFANIFVSITGRCVFVFTNKDPQNREFA